MRYVTYTLINHITNQCTTKKASGILMQNVYSNAQYTLKKVWNITIRDSAVFGRFSTIKETSPKLGIPILAYGASPRCSSA